MLYRLVFITCLGAVLEFFDFAIVMLFAGELSGAIVFSAEHVAPRYRGLLTASIVASAILGLVIASFMGVALHRYLTQEQLNS